MPEANSGAATVNVINLGKSVSPRYHFERRPLARGYHCERENADPCLTELENKYASLDTEVRNLAEAFVVA